jgi:hypothetical protein
MVVLKKKSSQNLASGDGGVVQAFFTRANGLASTSRLASPFFFHQHHPPVLNSSGFPSNWRTF